MYDVAIIGSGVIGNSIFRELTKYNLKVVVLEKEKMYRWEQAKQIQQ